MAHYALLDENNIVTEVITGRDENDLVQGVTSWEEYYGNMRGQRCLQTSYNTFGGIHYIEDEEGNRIASEDQSKALRKNYAGAGYFYDEARDAFIEPKPFSAWVLNEATCWWEPPFPKPATGKRYLWSEEAGDWVEVPSV